MSTVDKYLFPGVRTRVELHPSFGKSSLQLSLMIVERMHCQLVIEPSLPKSSSWISVGARNAQVDVAVNLRGTLAVI
jgi:hypothetical protein